MYISSALCIPEPEIKIASHGVFEVYLGKKRLRHCSKPSTPIWRGDSSLKPLQAHVHLVTKHGTFFQREHRSFDVRAMVSQTSIRKEVTLLAATSGTLDGIMSCADERLVQSERRSMVTGHNCSIKQIHAK